MRILRILALAALSLPILWKLSTLPAHADGPFPGCGHGIPCNLK